jgi:hypothetical protein
MSDETPQEKPQPSWDDLFEENKKLRELCVRYQEKLADLPSAQLLHTQNQEVALRAERAEDQVAALSLRVMQLEQQATIAGQSHDTTSLVAQLQQVTAERDGLLEEMAGLRAQLEELDGGPTLSFS